MKDIKIIKNLKKGIGEEKRNEKIIKEIENEGKKLEKENIYLNKNLNHLREKMKEIENGKSYNLWDMSVKENEIKKVELNKSLQNLKDMIDFKNLAKIWHKNKHEIEIINKYRANFKDSFKEDKLKILKKLDKTLVNNKKIDKKLKEILILENEIKNFKIVENPLSETKIKIKKILQEIEILNDKKFAYEKKRKKLIGEKSKIKKGLSDNLELFNVELDRV